MYSSEKNVQILLALMKKHNIRKIIISPGSANLSFVASVQDDNFFELYSCVDERSAAYMACGLSEESGEAVAISCTGATASRNYLPALTEAYYRKLPILAITSTRRISMIGQNVDQVIDRSNIQKDIAKISVTLPIVTDEETEWECNLKVNQALLELNHRDNGPVHVNLVTSYSTVFSLKTLPKVRSVERYVNCNNIIISDKYRIGIFIGSHSKIQDDLQNAIDEFCEKYDAFVMCDQTSNYKGRYGIYLGLLNSFDYGYLNHFSLDILIHIGNISAIWPLPSKEVWRVNADGVIRDTYRALTKVFEMNEVSFFNEMNSKSSKKRITTNYFSIFEIYKSAYELLVAKEKELPFSSLWIALKGHTTFPENAVVHFGILNSLRCWGCFDIGKKVFGYSNVGGFGIDGCVSSLIGASLADSNKIYFGVFGDLAFFYDMNCLGNRHIKNNLRIMVINNGLGVEFKRSDINVQRAGMGDKANKFICAKGHFGSKSDRLIKEYAISLGFSYIRASSKDDFDALISIFTNVNTEKSIIFEVFVDEKDDSDALNIIKKWNKEVVGYHEDAMDISKKIIKSIIGEKNINVLKKITNK